MAGFGCNGLSATCPIVWPPKQGLHVSEDVFHFGVEWRRVGSLAGMHEMEMIKAKTN